MNVPTGAVLERTYLLLTPTDGEPVPGHATQVVPGLCQAFAFDRAGHPELMTDDAVRRHGPDRLREAGVANLCRAVPGDAVDDHGLWTLDGSAYVGSLVLVLGHLIEAVTGAADPPEHGALVAMPARDLLMFHVIRDAPATWQARDRMIFGAADWYSGSEHQLSPWVYWWRPDGSLERVTESDEFTDLMLDLDLERAEAEHDALAGRLTEEQWARLRRLVRRSPAFLGMRIEMDDDGVRVVEPEELVLGFGPLVDAVAGIPPDDWPDVVDDLLGRMLDRLTEGVPELRNESLDNIFLRVRPSDPETDGWWTYAGEVAPGLLQVLALDLPDCIATLNDDQVRQHDLDELYDAAVRNLCGQLPETYADLDDVFVLEGTDHLASMVLVMPWVVEAVTGAPDFPHGVLVAVPNHVRLVFHVPRDAAGVRHALTEIARLAGEFHTEGPVPLSPWVYWWRPGVPMQQVARYDDSGEVIGADVVTDFSAEFAEVLAELDRVGG